MQHCAVDNLKCVVCSEHVLTREKVLVPLVNSNDSYQDRLEMMNNVVFRVFADACYNSFMPLPVTYPLITNERDCDAYMLLSAEQLKLKVAQYMYRNEKAGIGKE